MNLFNKIQIESDLLLLGSILAALVALIFGGIGLSAYQSHLAAELDSAAIKAGYVQVQNVGAAGYHWEPRR